MKTKKHIFIAMHYMEIGGAEISLIGLLQALDYSKYDVDLFIYSHQGELMQFIPKEVNLLPEIPAYAYIERPMKEALINGQLGVVWGRIKAKWQFRQYVKKKRPRDITAVFQFVIKNVIQFLPSLYRLGEYDLAISYLTPHNIVAEKVNATKKIAWIHTDYSTIDVNCEIELPVWSRYDHIISISQEVTKAFSSCFPSLKNKIVEIENILSVSFVRQRAELMSQAEVKKVMPKHEGEIHLLSVGRIVFPKNYDNVPDICKKVMSHLSSHAPGLSIKWYIIGFGIDENLVRRKIDENGMQDHVILLGKRSNPYPFIKACDIYVQPSRYEGKSITVREAQMLAKPVIITNYNTAKSQVKDGMDGVIVPLDNEGCAKGIADFVINSVAQQHIISHLKTHDYSNSSEINKLYQIINNT